MSKDKSNSEIIIYESEGGSPRIQVRLRGDTVLLSQAQIAELFGVQRPAITKHIGNIFAERELEEILVSSILEHTATDGKIYKTQFYNLDMIIAVGYRVNSATATHFRQWATTRLREYIVKGFAMDDERLKEMGGGGYWKELLTRIRDIRSSEKVFYRQILDIYATSLDYDAKAETSTAFFKKVQNKVHFAVHGKTAAEIIYTRANAEKDFMGLNAFVGSKPQLKDATVAKNYLDEKELRALGQIVSGYLDFAERQAEREVTMKMTDWVKHLNGILTSTGEQILLDAGSVSHEQAIDKVKTEYKKYQQKTLSEVEKAYLDTIVSIQKTAEKKVGDEK